MRSVRSASIVLLGLLTAASLARAQQDHEALAKQTQNRVANLISVVAVP